MIACERGHKGVVQILLQQEGIDINARNICLFITIFIQNISYFMIKFSIYLVIFSQHLCLHVKRDIKK